MKKINKLISCILFCAMLLSVFTVQCFAAAPSTVTPLWDNILDMELVISFYGNEGSATGRLTKQSGVTSVERTVTVYKLVGSDWVYVDSVYQSTTRTLFVSVDFVAESGVQYMAVFEGTAYRDDVGESHTMTNYKTCS